MDQRQFFVRDILTVIFKHKKLLIFFPLLVFAVVFVGNYVWPPTFESVAKVQLIRGREVSQADTTVTKAAGEFTMVQMSTEDINSEIQLILSQDVMKAVVEELQLHKDSAFPYGSGLLSVPFRASKSLINGALYLLKLKSFPSKLQAATDELSSRVGAESIRDTHVLQVTCRLGDPDKAQSILTTLLEVYNKQHIELFANEKSSPFFRDQKERVETNLTEAQAKLQGFRKEANISLLDTERELLLQEYTTAKSIMSQLSETAEALGQEGVDSTIISSLASETESTVVREMQLRLLELVLERNRVVQSLGPKHPTVMSLQEQVRTAQDNLIEAIATMKMITEKKLGTIQTRLDELNETKSELEKLEQEVQILSDNYEYYSQKLEESRVADELAHASISNVRMASRPSRPVDPVRPNKLLNLALAIIGGIIGALSLAFFADYLDHGIKTPEDLEYHTKLSPLASFFNAPGQPLDSREAERLAILIETAGIDRKSILVQVNSSIPREGAGQVAKALSEAFANDPEAKALLVDFTGDISQAKSAGYGLTDVLLDQADFDEVFGGDEPLTIVGRGTHSEYPSYLWGSERMDKFVETLRDRYKYIVFHVGPVLQSHDALKLARFADGILMVIKADSTRREVVCRALEMFGEAQEVKTDPEKKKKVAIGAVLTERTQAIPAAVYRRI